VKLLTTLLLAVLTALAVYTARRRIWFALRVGAITYIVLLFVRLFVFGAPTLVDRFDDIIWPVLIMLLLWVVLWVASTMYTQRRDRTRSR
jgi:hypothetical protein